MGTGFGERRGKAFHLYDLVEALLAQTDAPRLRLSSLEPWDLDENFFSLWSDPRLCRHLHLPLQSGSAETLRRMARKTTPESFARLVNAARSVSPEIAITTDIIAGFPGETEADFAESLDFVRRMDFAAGHVFTYSARPGTAAARMPDQVPMEIAKAAQRDLRAVLAESSTRYRQPFYWRRPGSAVGINGLLRPGWLAAARADRQLFARHHPFSGAPVEPDQPGADPGNK